MPRSLPSCTPAFSRHRGTRAAFSDLLNHPGSTAFLARVGTPPQLSGFVLGQLAADEAEILTFGVGKDSQRHGIGRKLVEALARAAKKAEARRLFLEVAADNIPALVLYKRLGFQEVGPPQRLLPAGRRAVRGCADAGVDALDQRALLRCPGASPITAKTATKSRFAQSVGTHARFARIRPPHA